MTTLPDEAVDLHRLHLLIVSCHARLNSAIADQLAQYSVNTRSRVPGALMRLQATATAVIQATRCYPGEPAPCVATLAEARLEFARYHPDEPAAGQRIRLKTLFVGSGLDAERSRANFRLAHDNFFTMYYLLKACGSLLQ